jgi:type II secretory pathway component PulL
MQRLRTNLEPLFMTPSENRSYSLLHLSPAWKTGAAAEHTWAKCVQGQVVSSGRGTLAGFSKDVNNLPVIVAMPAQQGHTSQHSCGKLSKRQRTAAQKHLLLPYLSTHEQDYHVVWQSFKTEMAAIAFNKSLLTTCIASLKEAGIEPDCITLDALLLPGAAGLTIMQTEYGFLLTVPFKGTFAIQHMLLGLVLADAGMAAVKQLTLVGKFTSDNLEQLTALGLPIQHVSEKGTHSASLLAPEYQTTTLNLLQKRLPVDAMLAPKEGFQLYWATWAMGVVALICAQLLITNNNTRDTIEQVQQGQITAYNKVFTQQITALPLAKLRQQVATIRPQDPIQQPLKLMLAFQQQVASLHAQKTGQEIHVHKLSYELGELQLQLETTPPWNWQAETRQVKAGYKLAWAPLTEHTGWLTVTIVQNISKGGG